MTAARLIPACTILALGAAFSGAARAAAPLFTSLYTFQQGADGGYPYSGLVAGPDGTFFGVTQGAGSMAQYGTVFQISPPAAGATAWTLRTLYTFTGGKDGAFAHGPLRAASGALFGSTGEGGTFNPQCSSGCGTIFELLPPASGTTKWRFKSVYAFSGGLDGAYPVAAPTFGMDGALYGTAYGGGTCASNASGCGVVYRLAPPTGTAKVWTETTLLALGGGADGASPFGTPVFGKDGVLYVTNRAGGIVSTPACKTNGGCGTVFSLTPPPAGKTAWTQSTLYTFTGTLGSNPRGGVSIDVSGNLFGTAHNGGHQLTCPATDYTNPGCGTVFELVPPGAGSTKWAAKLLYAFKDGPDGSKPWDPPLLKDGELYLTSSGDEVKTDGSVLRLTPPAAGHTVWRETTLYSFQDKTDSDDPYGALILRNGILYGTTNGDGAGPAPAGGVFSLTP